MAISQIVCSALVFLCCTWGALGSLDTALGDSSSCHHVCEATYPLHTYPEVSVRHKHSEPRLLLLHKHRWPMHLVVYNLQAAIGVLLLCSHQ